MSYATRTEELPVLSVPMTRAFVNVWRRGRFLQDPQMVTEYLNTHFGVGYIDRKPRCRGTGSYTLRFDQRKLVVPLHRNGSPNSWEMIAQSRYHERRPFQLGRRRTRPAKLEDDSLRSGLVTVDWRTMY